MNRLHLFRAAPPVDDALLSRFRQLYTPAVSDCLERTHGAVGLSAVGNCLSEIGNATMAGPALTVRTRPGDNLVVHKALDLARPGDVLVIDARGEITNAIMGELMCTYARERGIAGIVLDGAVRDFNALSAGIIPVFARGVSHLGPYKSGPGEIHGSIQVGGVVVNDGDIIVGDADGIVVVPRRRAEATATAAEAVVANEQGHAEAIRKGTWDRTWIDAALEIVHAEAIEP